LINILVENWKSFITQVDSRSNVHNGNCYELKEKCRTPMELKEYAYKISAKFLEQLGEVKFFFDYAEIYMDTNKYSKFLFSMRKNSNKNYAFLFK